MPNKLSPSDARLREMATPDIRKQYGENPARMKYTIHNYVSAFFAEERARRSRRTRHKVLGHNTYIDKDGDDVLIILHSTPIVVYKRDGRIKLNSGGYQTTTTKARMNEVLPPGVRVFAKDYDWYVSVAGHTIPFEDGMVIQDPHHERQDMQENPPRRKNPGKFDDALDEVLYHVDHQETASYPDGQGWYGKIVRLQYSEAVEVADEMQIDREAFRKAAAEFDWPLHAIVYEDSDGRVSSAIYTTVNQIDREWDRIERDVATSHESDDEE